MGYAYPIDSKVVTNPNGTIDYDRASNSSQLRGLIKSMITNGVNLTESTNLQVMADEETMNLIVMPGYVIIEGALKHFEDDVKVTIGAADTTNPRIDTVVARLNLNEDVRDIVIDVLQGTPSAEPVAPELTRTTSYYEVGLADIVVEVGASQISQEVVIDTRLLNSRCGLATSIGEIDTETLFVQLTTDFNNWFDSIKGKLGDDVAGGLQMQIDGLADDIDTLQEDVESLEGRVEVLENRGSGLAPYPVTNVKTEQLVFTEGIENATLKVSWTKPTVYDIQVGHYIIYGYVGDTAPTDMSDFTLVTTTQNTSIEVDVTNPYNYVLVASVSVDGIVQKNLSQMATVTVFNIRAKGLTLAEATWDEISDISEVGLASEYFSVGDTKSISINGTNYNALIYDFDHDDKNDGSGKAGITFGLANCLTTAYTINSSNFNSGGWHSSELRNTLGTTIYNQLDDSLKNVIKTVLKKASKGGKSTALNTSPDKLFMFSMVEIVGGTSPNSTAEGEGTKYPIFTTSNSRIKKKGDIGSLCRWWTRSPMVNDTGAFQSIEDDGSIIGAPANYSDVYVCFGFCV